MRERALLFGAGKNCVDFYTFLSRLYVIVGIVDNSPTKQGIEVCGFQVNSATAVRELDYDVIIVTPVKQTEIVEQLLAEGLGPDKIITLSEILEEPFRRLRGINIAVIFHGGIGDYLIGLNWLYHLVDYCALSPRDAKIDAYIEDDSTGTKSQLFTPCDIINNVYSKVLTLSLLQDSTEYDLVIHFCIVPYVQQFCGERLSALYPKLLDYIVDLQKYGWKNYCFGFCNSPRFYETIKKVFEMFPEKNYYSFCDLFSNLNITEEFICPFSVDLPGETYLEKMGLEKNQYILIDATMNHYPNPVSSTRAWPEKYWIELVNLIKQQNPSLKVIQIGTYVEDRADLGADLNLSGETNLGQLKALLRSARLLVDYEGGLVHMRHILHGGPSVVLFGPTAVEQH